MRILLAIVLFAVVFSRVSSVRANSYEMAAVGCVPGDPAWNFDRHLITAGTIKHKGTNVDLITLYCPIPTNISAPSNIQLTFSDNNSSSTTYVSAAYVKMDKASGSITTIATATSENGTENGTVQTVTAAFSDSYNLAFSLYYVRVDIDRDSTSDSPTFYGVKVY